MEISECLIVFRVMQQLLKLCIRDRAESDLYECNEFEVAVLTGAPLWRLRDFRSAKNNYYPFVKLPKPKSDETRKVKRDVRKVVYPLGRLRAALNSI